MRLQPIISGLVTFGIGFALDYYNVVDNQYISYGVMGVGVGLILLGFFMKRR
jgi:hypothetical protein